MYFRFCTLLPVAALAAVAAAAPSELKARDGGQCNTGPIQCCNQTVKPTDATISELLGLLGVVVSGLTGVVGINCTPIDVAGLGSNSCSSQPVCCDGNTNNGLLNLNCNPINVGL